MADLAIWRLVGWLSGGGIDGIPPSYVRDSFPALAKLVAAVDAEEAVQSWKAKHPDAYGEK